MSRWARPVCSVTSSVNEWPASRVVDSCSLSLSLSLCLCVCVCVSVAHKSRDIHAVAIAEPTELPSLLGRWHKHCSISHTQYHVDVCNESDYANLLQLLKPFDEVHAAVSIAVRFPRSIVSSSSLSAASICIYKHTQYTCSCFTCSWPWCTDNCSKASKYGWFWS